MGLAASLPFTAGVRSPSSSSLGPAKPWKLMLHGEPTDGTASACHPVVHARLRVHRQTWAVGVPASPRRRKLRMVREGETPDDLLLVIRASPATRSECLADLVADASRSGRLYVVADASGRREVLFGVSVFARRSGVAPIEVLARFDAAPTYLEASVGQLREAGLTVLPTGVNPDHYDVQLVAGHREEDLEPLAAIRVAAERLVEAAGDLRPNPAYAGGSGRPSEEPS